LNAGTHTIKAKAFKIDILPSETSIATYNISLSTKDNELSQLIIIFPNPTTDELLITNYKLRITNIEVFDSYGKKILSHTADRSQQTTIDVSLLNRGTYFLKIDTDKGVIFKKIVKN